MALQPVTRSATVAENLRPVPQGVAGVTHYTNEMARIFGEAVNTVLSTHRDQRDVIIEETRSFQLLISNFRETSAQFMKEGNVAKCQELLAIQKATTDDRGTMQRIDEVVSSLHTIGIGAHSKLMESAREALSLRMQVFLQDEEMTQKMLALRGLEQQQNREQLAFENAEQAKKEERLKVVYDSYVATYKQQLSIGQDMIKKASEKGRYNCTLNCTEPTVNYKTMTATPGSVSVYTKAGDSCPIQ